MRSRTSGPTTAVCDQARAVSPGRGSSLTFLNPLDASEEIRWRELQRAKKIGPTTQPAHGATQNRRRGRTDVRRYDALRESTQDEMNRDPEHQLVATEVSSQRRFPLTDSLVCVKHEPVEQAQHSDPEKCRCEIGQSLVVEGSILESCDSVEPVVGDLVAQDGSQTSRVRARIGADRDSSLARSTRSTVVPTLVSALVEECQLDPAMRDPGVIEEPREELLGALAIGSPGFEHFGGVREDQRATTKIVDAAPREHPRESTNRPLHPFRGNRWVVHVHPKRGRSADRFERLQRRFVVAPLERLVRVPFSGITARAAMSASDGHGRTAPRTGAVSRERVDGFCTFRTRNQVFVFDVASTARTTRTPPPHRIRK